jgi:hypothetical protein
MTEKTTPPTPPTPPTGGTKTNPALVLRRPPASHVAGDPDPAPEWTPFDPDLTRGQTQVLKAEETRLFRMLSARTPRAMLGVIVLLEDLAGQAPAVDAALEEEDKRRRLDAARPHRPATLLTKGPRS